MGLVFAAPVGERGAVVVDGADALAEAAGEREEEGERKEAA
jgi:hypothetical protein